MANIGVLRMVAVLGVAMVCLWLFRVEGLRTESSSRWRREEDPHGGVKMGESRTDCDNAQENLEVDWDPQSTAEFTCDDGVTLQPTENKVVRNCVNETHRPLHVCFPHPIYYSEDEIPPTSGAHRPLWPQYGEYTYLPPQRWLHNLEHGAIVFLYHPCAEASDVEKMRQVATRCLRKHIITPYKLLPLEMPFAALSWGCKLLMSRVQTSILLQFVQDRALRAPEGSVASRGQYSVGLKVPAKVVSDYNDQKICPGVSADEIEVAVGEGSNDSENQALGNSHVTSEGEGSKLTQDTPSGRPVNWYIVESQQRRQGLKEEAERLHQNVQRLIHAFKGLTQKK